MFFFVKIPVAVNTIAGRWNSESVSDIGYYVFIVYGTDSGSYPVAGFGISVVEALSSVDLLCS
jgi:hypothetical protein